MRQQLLWDDEQASDGNISRYFGNDKEQKYHGDTPKQTWRRKIEQLSDFGEEKVSNEDHND